MRWRNRKWLVARLTSEVNALGAQNVQTVANWVEAARARGPVLFVGAGWTKNAKFTPRADAETVDHAEAPKLWNQLAADFAADLRADLDAGAATDALWLAELYRQRFGRDAMLGVLRRAVPNDSLAPDSLHEALRAVPWRAVLTTNFDTLLQRTFKGANVCVDDVDFVRSSEGGALELIHLHGIIDRPDTIVLAHEDYRRYAERHPGTLAKVRQLFLQHPVMFVGFGLTDPNFMQWAGWISDVVGDAKNPWVSLVFGAAPSLAHARYWGAKLEFVGIDAKDFAATASGVFRVIGEALQPDERTEEIAFERLRSTDSRPDILREVQEQFELGRRTGAEGSSWERFAERLVDAAASRVLDLAGERWIEPSTAEQEQTAGLRIEIGKQLHDRQHEARTAEALERAFGPDWERWRSLVREHVTEHQFWHFSRHDLTSSARANIWNSAFVPVRSAPEASAGIAESPSALSALRDARAIEPRESPGSAQEWRESGYFAMQEARTADAIRAYRRAVDASSAEGEHLRVQWLTVESYRRALDSASFAFPIDERKETREQGDMAAERARELRDQIARLPKDGRLDDLYFQEADAERKLAKQFIEDLTRYDVDTTSRYGDHYGSARRWMDRLEKLFVAPSIVAPAAEALGALEWRFGDLEGAARTFARYGSKRLATFTEAYVKDVNGPRERIASLSSELLRDGRWSGEWLARAEAVRFLVPGLDEAGLARLARFVEDARKAVGERDFAPRGAFVHFQWHANHAIERLEPARWPFLDGRAACAAIATWTQVVAPNLDTDAFIASNALVTIQDLPWVTWIAGVQVSREDVGALLVGLVDARLAKTRVPGTNARARDDLRDVVELLNMLLSLKEELAINQLSDLESRFGRLVELLPQEEHDVFEVSLARIKADLVRCREVADRTIERVTADAPGDGGVNILDVDFDTLAAAGVCSSSNVPKLISFLRERLEQARALKGEPAGPMRWRGSGEALAGRIGYVLGGMLRDAEIRARADVLEVVRDVVRSFPAAVEHLTAASDGALGDVAGDVHDAVVALLRADVSGTDRTRRELQFAGIRALVRALVQRGAATVAPEWLTNVCLLSRGPYPDVSQYAAWALSEWANRADDAATAKALVGPTLRATSADARVGHQANGVRGLVALESRMPEASNARVLQRFKDDPRVAIRRAFENVGVLR